jgi:ubiquitin C-terminal hydrolase
MEWTIKLYKCKSFTSLFDLFFVKIYIINFIIFFVQEYAAKRHQEFVGNGQHDAQELLTILLDAIHEVKNFKENI